MKTLKENQILEVAGDRGVGKYHVEVIKRMHEKEKEQNELTGENEQIYLAKDKNGDVFFITNATGKFEIDPFL